MTCWFAKQSLLATCALAALPLTSALAQYGWIMPATPRRGFSVSDRVVQSPYQPMTTVQDVPLYPQQLPPQQGQMQPWQMQQRQMQQWQTQQRQTQQGQMQQQAQSQQQAQVQPGVPIAPQASMPLGQPQLPVVVHSPAGGLQQAAPQPYAYNGGQMGTVNPVEFGRPHPGVISGMARNQAIQPIPEQNMPQANPYVQPPGAMANRRTTSEPALGTPVTGPLPNGPLLSLMREATQLERNGQLPEAIAKYNQALNVDPHNWQVQLSFARVKHRIGDLDGALNLYQKLLATYPNDAVSLNDVGLLLARQGNIRDAKVRLERAVALQPQSKRYRNNLATVLIEADELNEALANLQDVHGEAIGEFNLAYLLAQRGQVKLAAEHLRVALHLDPSMSPARELLESLGGPAEQIATRSIPDDRSSAPIILRQGGETNPSSQPTTRPAVYEAQPGEGSHVAPVPSDFEIPGIQKRKTTAQ